MTKQLYERALRSKDTGEARRGSVISFYAFGSPLTLSAGIDSVYSHALPSHLYNNVFIMAGGAGISGSFPYLRYISRTPPATPAKSSLSGLPRVMPVCVG